MIWDRLFSRGRWDDLGAAMRAEHSAFLTDALATGRPMPRIPLKASSTGGFDRVLARASGRVQAERWWKFALLRVV
jgi:hypothetical protein